MNLEAVHQSFLEELGKIAKDLSHEARSHIKPSNFALSSEQSSTGHEAYPIQSRHQAGVALGMVGMHGSPDQKREVYEDVVRKYPDLAQKSSAVPTDMKKKANSFDDYLKSEKAMKKRQKAIHDYEQMQSKMAAALQKMAGEDPEAWKKRTKKQNFLHGAGEEAAGAVGMTIGAGIGNMYGHPLQGAGIGYGLGAATDWGARELMEHLAKKRMAQAAQAMT